MQGAVEGRAALEVDVVTGVEIDAVEFGEGGPGSGLGVGGIGVIACGAEVVAGGLEGRSAEKEGDGRDCEAR